MHVVYLKLTLSITHLSGKFLVAFRTLIGFLSVGLFVAFQHIFRRKTLLTIHTDKWSFLGVHSSNMAL